MVPGVRHGGGPKYLRGADTVVSGGPGVTPAGAAENSSTRRNRRRLVASYELLIADQGHIAIDVEDGVELEPERRLVFFVP
jgi:hypothetical protein